MSARKGVSSESGPGLLQPSGETEGGTGSSSGMVDPAHHDEGTTERRLREERLAKAEKLKSLGINPYGNGLRPAHLAAHIHSENANRKAEELETLKPGPYSVAGRVVSVRDFGKAGFIVVQDRSGSIQVHVKRDALGETAFAPYKLLDVGDFVFVVGTAFRSKTGELTLAASEYRPLTKTLRPLPGKFSKGDDADSKAWVEKQALADVEERYRRRYLDLLSNPRVKETFVKRTKLIQFIRQFLNDRDFLEVETPMMHPLVSGAAAKPFKTHHNTLGLDLYMRIAPELYLKRLVVGGLDRVYEINRNFRNEGISTRHNPEFTMLEFYEAYATYQVHMDLTEEMISEAASFVSGGSKVTYGDQVIDFSKGWPRIPMREAIISKVKDLGERDFADLDKLRAVALRRAESPADKAAVASMNLGELVGTLFEQHVEASLINPTFITEFPVETSPLARRNDANSAITDRFELFCMGREIANGFSELNDPVDQEQRFRAQVEAKTRGQQETMDYDEDYIRALEHGLPPTAGEGIGIDRLCMLLTDAPSIRDVILFPLLRPHASK
jgi:lysyl-tRNA synthetase class 2